MIQSGWESRITVANARVVSQVGILGGQRGQLLRFQFLNQFLAEQAGCAEHGDSHSGIVAGIESMFGQPAAKQFF